MVTASDLQTFEMKRDDRLLAVLREVEEYLDDRADADHNGNSFVPNEAMRLLTEVRAAIAVAEARDARR